MSLFSDTKRDGPLDSSSRSILNHGAFTPHISREIRRNANTRNADRAPIRHYNEYLANPPAYLKKVEYKYPVMFPQGEMYTLGSYKMYFYPNVTEKSIRQILMHKPSSNEIYLFFAKADYEWQLLYDMGIDLVGFVFESRDLDKVRELIKNMHEVDVLTLVTSLNEYSAPSGVSSANNPYRNKGTENAIKQLVTDPQLLSVDEALNSSGLQKWCDTTLMNVDRDYYPVFKEITTNPMKPKDISPNVKYINTYVNKENGKSYIFHYEYINDDEPEDVKTYDVYFPSTFHLKDAFEHIFFTLAEAVLYTQRSTLDLYHSIKEEALISYNDASKEKRAKWTRNFIQTSSNSKHSKFLMIPSLVEMQIRFKTLKHHNVI